MSDGPGITEASFATTEGDIKITRADGRTATLSWPGRVDRMLALHRRDTAELLAEELRRLDPDEVYAETLRGVDLSPPAALPAAGTDGQSTEDDGLAGDDGELLGEGQLEAGQ